MKTFYCIALVALAIVGPARAQTNAVTSTNAVSNTNTSANATVSTNANTNAVSQILALVTTNAPVVKPPPRGATHIESDSVDFDLTKREATYRGHVRVDDPEMKLRCEWLVADLPQTGGRMTNIVAETNVVIDATDNNGQKIHATGDKAVYTYNVLNGVTNEIVTLTGNAKVERTDGWLTGEPITLDCVTKQIHADNAKMVYWQNLNSALAGTNVPSVKTNLPVVETNLPVTETNLPVVETNLAPPATNQTTAPK